VNTCIALRGQPWLDEKRFGERLRDGGLD